MKNTCALLKPLAATICSEEKRVSQRFDCGNAASRVEHKQPGQQIERRGGGSGNTHCEGFVSHLPRLPKEVEIQFDCTLGKLPVRESMQLRRVARKVAEEARVLVDCKIALLTVLVER